MSTSHNKGPESEKPIGESVERIRGTINIPINAEGRKYARQLGQYFASKGNGVDRIATSNLVRTKETADIIKKANPGAEFIYVGDGFHPWHLGMLEGEPPKPKIFEALVKNPEKAALGTSPSGQKGESFNTFKRRFLKRLWQIWALSPKKDKTTVIVTHYRGIKLTQCWVAEGGVIGNYDVNEEMFLEKTGVKFDSIWQLLPGPKPGTIKLKEIYFTDEDAPNIGSGVYIVRHGETDMN